MTAKNRRFIAALCVLLFICGITGCAAEEMPVLGLPVERAIAGTAEGINLAKPLAAVPDAIWDKVAQQPDTMEFAMNYYRYGQRNLDMDISADVAAGEVPLLLQWDKRWGYEMYGGNYMGINGCAPTALAIVYAGLTGNTDVTPYDLALYAVDAGLYLPGQGTRWEMMETGGSYLGLKVQRVWRDERAIREALAAGKLLTVRVGAGDFTTGGHFLVVCGIDENDLLTIRDPNSREKTAQLWEFSHIMEQSSCWWSFGV